MRYLIAAAVLGLAGSSFADIINVPADYATIQGAVDAAVDGDEVVVAPGTYTGTGYQVVDMLGKAITLRASGTPEETIIDGEGARRGILCDSGETAATTIVGFSITGGSASDGGGIACYSSPTLTDCTISGNTASKYGGGIWCFYSHPTLTDCTISNNTASYGGGIYCWYGSNPTITSCTISGNTSDSIGGGIACYSSNLTLTDCTISGNTSDSIGGGIWCEQSDPTITNCEISNNTADSADGGGIWCSYSHPTLSGCTISNNTAIYGGGIWCYSSNPTLTDTAVCCNAPNQISCDWADDGSNHVADACIDDCNCNQVSDLDDVANGTSFDCDQDLVPDECEPDCDGDGLIDDCDSEPDIDGNGVPDNCDPDCNENGIADGVEILFGWADDCDGDVVPDDCQLADGSAADCDFDGTLDHCQFADNPDLDCDENGVLDSCEVEPVLTQTVKLTADDAASGDWFGSSVAIDAGVAVIGAYQDDDDDNGTNSGSAYVYEQQADGIWLQTVILTADDGASGDYFGNSVAINAGVAVIGAQEDDDNGTNSGSAYVYEQQANGTWVQIAKLTADDGAIEDRFGNSVAINAGVAVIGARNDDDNGTDSGSAYVYEQQANGTWVQIAKLTADVGGIDNYFGWSVAIDAGVAVIGVRFDDDNGTNSGSAYVYEQQADGIWLQTVILTADDGAPGDQFGWSVAINAGVAVIGATTDDDNGTNSGSAYVYEQQTNGTWVQIAKLTADDGGIEDRFGNSVAIDAGVAVIAAIYDDDNGNQSGSAYVYEQQANGTWVQIAKLTADDGTWGDYFGNSVAIDAGVAIIGTQEDDDNGTNSGSAYVFETFSQADCDANGLMDDCEIEENPSLDCDLDGVLDSCAIADGSVDDCNENGIPDSCDIANGGDADGDGYLDECECNEDIAGPDGPGFQDGEVNVDDLLTVIGYWGSDIDTGDVNGDGIVDTNDILAVLSAWGPCP